MKKVKIGRLTLKNPYLLAPMEAVNDIVFRKLCSKCGAGLVYTGMTNPLTQQNLSLEDKPAIQFFCNTEKGVKEFIKKHEKETRLFDFNLGCPSKLAKKANIGCFMLDDSSKLEIIEKVLKIARESTKKPLTIKIRKSKNSLQVLKIAEKYCDAITIHPRTCAQGYSGKPDIEFAKQIKRLTSLPMIYSGNVNEKNAKDLLKYFDAVMIGREAIGNPNIFSRLTGKKNLVTFKDYLKEAKKRKFYFSQIKFQAMNFTKGMKNAKKMRLRLIHAKKLEDIESIFELSQTKHI
ncbi:MAG: tRNA-dihydrouridine synthase family protein [Candidatus Pacearchaeota archaeon]|nr:tRNA-dihydrouridine synthase family protein [Candidatus Pacearchaeota archaeon]